MKTINKEEDLPNRFSFNDNPNIPDKSEINKQIKIDQSKSRFANKKSSISRKAQFQQKVNEAHEKFEGYQLEAIKLGQEFNNFFNKKTLSKNKGPLEKSFEKEIINKLINYAVDVNNDELQQKDGMGSVAIITLLLNTILKLKNQLNENEYQCSNLKYSLEETCKKLERLEDKTQKQLALYDLQFDSFKQGQSVKNE